MSDKKTFENMDRHFSFEKLSLDDLEGVTGGTSYGRVHIDDEACKNDLIAYKNQGWTYDEVVKLLSSEVFGVCSEDEQAFMLNYIKKTWNSI